MRRIPGQRNSLAPVLGVLLVLVCTAASAQNGHANIRLSTGIEYSSGKFGGTDSIDDVYVPVTFSVDQGRLGFRLTVPYLSVTAPSGTTTTDPAGQPIPGSGSRTTESGLGDVVGSVTFYDLVYDADTGLALDLTGAAKFGTADRDRGLGTGENDYTLRFEAYRFLDQVTWFGTAGYRLRGEPAGVELLDVFLGSVGAAWQAPNDTQVGLAFDFRESAVAGLDDIQELSGFATFRLNRDWQVHTYAFTGFTDSSPNWGVGIGLSTYFEGFRIRDGF